MMDREQIVADICPFYKEYGSCKACDDAIDTDDEPCYYGCVANVIIDNNYHKQREGEWIDNHNGTFTCTACGGRASKMNYCGNCGAKMKGGNN